MERGIRAGWPRKEGGGAQVRRPIGVLNCKTGMGKTFDIGLERLTGGSEFSIGSAIHTVHRNASRNEGSAAHAGARDAIRGALRGTFFLETFGCQMNDHDSEKVAGVLL